MNWDAFSDCLTDLSWIDSGNDFLIVYKNSQKFRAHQPEDWQIANEILLEAMMDYWNEQGEKDGDFFVVVFVTQKAATKNL
jgi:hypothetical protein